MKKTKNYPLPTKIREEPKYFQKMTNDKNIH